MARDVFIREVGLRDGLQLVATVLSTERKVAWAKATVAAGIGEVEVTSFVPPSVIHQFIDAAEVAAQTVAIPGLTASALVPNLKGAVRALDCGVRALSYVISASEAHSRANVHRTTDEAFQEFGRIVDLVRERSLSDSVRLSCGIATAFGCTLQGKVDEGVVIELAHRLTESGADEIMLADTVGYANPGKVKRLFSVLVHDGIALSAHFHDTRGLGLANVAAALETGVRRFDASLAGLGGCPFAPGATGNINTEDTAYLCESLGLATGIDIDALVALRRDVENWLPNERFAGAIERAGLPKDFLYVG